MKLIWKGIYHKEEELPKGELPPQAVPFQEPKNLAELNRQAGSFLPVILGLAVVVILARWLLWGPPGLWDCFGVVGLVLFLPGLLLHEFLHALCYPLSAICEIWLAPRDGALLVVSTFPVSKARFLFVSLFPSIMLGALPLVLWSVFPVLQGDIFTFGVLSLFSCTGDWLNVKNTVQQVPDGAMIQGSGLHSYWYPKEFIKNQY